jgi:hypothetical protein
MIEPLLWALMCACAIAVCWVKIRGGSVVWSFSFLVLAILFAKSGWHAFEAMLAAMEATSAGRDVAPFRETVLIGAPLIAVLAWPFVMDALRARRAAEARDTRRPHGSA